MEDRREILRNEAPFSWREIKNQKIQVFYNRKLIKTLQGKDYDKFQRIRLLGDDFEMQLFLAKITGQFKHGNEKLSKNLAK
jgi:hypothetical protein